MLARSALALTVLTASTSLVAAQSASSLVDGLSATCQAAALSLLSNSQLAQCASIGSLSSIVLTSGSVVDPVRRPTPFSPSEPRLGLGLPLLDPCADPCLSLPADQHLARHPLRRGGLQRGVASERDLEHPERLRDRDQLWQQRHRRASHLTVLFQ